jgi:hypothetical protein
MTKALITGLRIMQSQQGKSWNECEICFFREEYYLREVIDFSGEVFTCAVLVRVSEVFG